VRIRPDERFVREGNDIYTTVAVSITQAALGATIRVPTLDGEEEVELPPGTQPGETLVLAGRGMPVLDGSGRGDELILVTVLAPRQLRLLQHAQQHVPLKRFVIVGGEPELALLLHIFPEGVEELDGAFAVYAHEPPLGFDVVEVEDVRGGWEHGWRAFHHGVMVGRLWVGPPWEQPPADAVSVVIDPGLAFGTGAHPTTRLCLELLQEVEPLSLVDVGCGSGVLSIAAAKLGFAPVAALDLDMFALEVTATNAAANGVEVELVDTPRAADLAVMNIALDVVNAILPTLEVPRVITSGYLERDTPTAADWVSVERRVLDGWAADLLEFRS
jgi:ribosomal protein L11 methyltransferase